MASLILLGAIILSVCSAPAQSDMGLYTCKDVIAVYKILKIPVIDCLKTTQADSLSQQLMWRIDKPMDYDSALKACAFGGRATLASIHDYTELEDALGLDKDKLSGITDCWIGLRRSKTDHNAFEWADGTSFDYPHWAIGSPKASPHDCAIVATDRDSDNHKQRWIAHTSSGLYGKPCDEKHFPICKTY